MSLDSIDLPYSYFHPLLLFGTYCLVPSLSIMQRQASQQHHGVYFHGSFQQNFNLCFGYSIDELLRFSFLRLNVSEILHFGRFLRTQVLKYNLWSSLPLRNVCYLSLKTLEFHHRIAHLTASSASSSSISLVYLLKACLHLFPHAWRYHSDHHYSVLFSIPIWLLDLFLISDDLEVSTIVYLW